MGSANAEVIVAAVALVISVVALLATFMQVLQQYYASAYGYSECNEKVMGKWAETKSRKFSWHELRFEVEFQSPVIFVAPPTNVRGPVPNARIAVLDGTDESMHNSRTTSDVDHNKSYNRPSPMGHEKIHTADNERASWLELLSAVQRMERDSSAWQAQQYRAKAPPRSGEDSEPCQMPPTQMECHTLAVAIQGKQRSWVTMPRSITKPYATTTICHLIEMMAALGIYWTEFDRRRDRYRAEGNGFMLMGERLSDLGLCFSFQTYGKCQFNSNRVIPADEIKELCFGYVPTIYRETLDQRRLEEFNDGLQNLSHLQMASRNEIAESLTLIGCNNNTVRYFSGSESSVTSHLFPVAFEVLGMLCLPIHIQGTFFTYVPNPTPYRWDKRSFSLVKLMQAFRKYFNGEPPSVLPGRNSRLQRTIQTHLKTFDDLDESTSGRDRFLYMKALCDALRDVDEVLTGRAFCIRDVGGTHRAPMQHEDSWAKHMTTPTEEKDKHKKRRVMVQDVLRSHLQEVLRLLNENEERAATSVPETLTIPFENSGLSAGPPSSPEPTRSSGPTFQDMNAASPDERQDRFMQVYFDVICPLVVSNAQRSTMSRRRNASRLAMLPPPFGHELRRRSSGRSNLASGNLLVSRDRSPVPSIATRTTSGDFEVAPRRQSMDVHPRTQSSTKSSSLHDAVSGQTGIGMAGRSLADEDVSHVDIWFTLVFRMICWLTLHDFNKMDVQLPKSELRGSRMPVYIS
ncbi:hypothetical protein NLU13_6878 [Sarocladium strictum]|uniref:Modin n=1 Tax=Sarocladium strictum TaxID=5046 RepID=A0AA39GEI1_SARSR|nr:hypothetical protein NLU13_6878 [Sarocladium strictum]